MADPAIDQLRKALEQSPDNLPLRLMLVRALLGAGAHDEAERECRRGLERAPHDADLGTALAEAFLARGRFSAALVVCEGLADRGLARPTTHLVMARCYFAQEEHARAAESYRRAVDLDPTLRDERLESLVAGAGRGAGKAPAGAEPRGPAPERPPRERELAEGTDHAQFAPYVERSKTTFADVGGMEALKEEIRIKILYPLQRPEIYAAYGKKIGGGILLYGPPGCGKTHLARATAGEGKSKFVSVSISDVLDMYVGQSERNLRDVFASARANRPCVLFFDEVDALAANRRDMRHSGGRQAVNQFLAELDGIDTDNEGLLIMAATNAPWHLDSAFRRPGRFDRILFVPPPDAEARAAILKVLLRGKPAGDVDVDAVAKKTQELSGADLKALVDLAIEAKLKEALKSGRPEPLTTKDLLRAAAGTRASTKEWFTTARNHALFANQNGLYDDVLSYLGIRGK